MDLSLYIVLDKDGEIIAHFDDLDDALAEFGKNPNADELANADLQIIDKETIFTSGAR